MAQASGIQMFGSGSGDENRVCIGSADVSHPDTLPAVRPVEMDLAPSDGIQLLGSGSESEPVPVPPVSRHSLWRIQIVEGIEVRVRLAYNRNGRSFNDRWLVFPCPIHFCN